MGTFVLQPAGADDRAAREDSFGNRTTFAYIAASGNGVADALSQMVDPAGTTLGHDAEERLTSVTRPDPGGRGSPVLQFTYDADTHLMTAFTDATGGTTTLEYDAARTLRKRIEPGGATHQTAAAMITGFVDTSMGLAFPSPRPMRWATSRSCNATMKAA